MPNNYGLMTDRQHVSGIDISDDCHMHLPLATILSALPSADAKTIFIYFYGSLGPRITRARNINLSFRNFLGGGL
jgi:hypothetical protein